MLNRRASLVTAATLLVLALAACDSDTESKSGAAVEHNDLQGQGGWGTGPSTRDSLPY